MLKILCYIFKTGKDQRLYYDPENLFSELLSGGFSIPDVMNAINWFKPITDTKKALLNSYRNKGVRHLDYMENKFLSENLFNFILQEEQKGVINSYQRDLIIDRVSLVAQIAGDMNVEELIKYLI